MIFTLRDDKKGDEMSCFGLVPDRPLEELPNEPHRRPEALDGGCLFRCCTGQMLDGDGASAESEAFALHPPKGELRIVVDLERQQATFYVNGRPHPKVATGLRLQRQELQRSGQVALARADPRRVARRLGLKKNRHEPKSAR